MVNDVILMSTYDPHPFATWMSESTHNCTQTHEQSFGEYYTTMYISYKTVNISHKQFNKILISHLNKSDKRSMVSLRYYYCYFYCKCNRTFLQVTESSTFLNSIYFGSSRVGNTCVVHCLVICILHIYLDSPYCYNSIHVYSLVTTYTFMLTFSLF